MAYCLRHNDSSVEDAVRRIAREPDRQSARGSRSRRQHGAARSRPSGAQALQARARAVAAGASGLPRLRAGECVPARCRGSPFGRARCPGAGRHLRAPSARLPGRSRAGDADPDPQLAVAAAGSRRAARGDRPGARQRLRDARGGGAEGPELAPGGRRIRRGRRRSRQDLRACAQGHGQGAKGRQRRRLPRVAEAREVPPLPCHAALADLAGSDGSPLRSRRHPGRMPGRTS